MQSKIHSSTDKHYTSVYAGVLKLFKYTFRIVASHNEKYPVGKYVTASFGWRTHTICNPAKYNTMANLLPLTLLPNIDPHPISLALGVLGMPG